MASKGIKGITVEFNGETQGLDKALQSVNAEAKKFNSTLKDVNKALKLDPTNTDLLKENAAHAQVELENQLEEDLWVLFDRDGLYQVVFNLVENAIKYNRTGGRVSVATSMCDDKVCVSITDTGYGVPDEFRDHIFHLLITGCSPDLAMECVVQVCVLS